MVGTVCRITYTVVAWGEPHGGPEVPGILLQKDEIALILHAMCGMGNEENMILCRGRVLWVLYDAVTPI